MKNHLSLICAALLCLTLVSWGYEGHYAVAEIAEKHLSDNAKTGVKNLLGRQTMAAVSSFADDLRNEPEYKGTAGYHYINVPAGLSFDQFADFVKNDKEKNIYSGLLGCISTLKKPTATKAQKAFALEFLIHLVGDAHQPMHVSRAEDKGGNSVTVNFVGSNTSLHGLWDSGLIDHQRIPYKTLGDKYDTATPEQIKKWQADSVMVWLWESYQISAILYHEAEDNTNFDELYYEQHIPVVKNRIEKAGIRLAGILNSIYN